MASCRLAQLVIVIALGSVMFTAKETYGCLRIFLIQGRCIDCDEVNREITAMQNSLKIAEGSTQEVIDEIRQLISTKNGVDLQANLQAVSQELLQLGKIPTADYEKKFAQLQNSLQKVRMLTESRQVNISSINENLSKSVTEAASKKESPMRFQSSPEVVNNATDEAKRHIDIIQKSLYDMKQELRGYNDMLASNISNMLAMNSKLQIKSETLMQATTKIINGRLNSISSVQQKEIERMQLMTTTRVGELRKMAELVKAGIGERQTREAEKMLDTARQLNSSIGISMSYISERLDEINDDQESLDMVIKYSKALNRIHYLFSWWKRLGGEEVVNRAHRVSIQNWAKAVLFGEPSDQPIEVILDALESLIAGNSSNSFPLGRKSSDNGCLLDIYLSNVREHIQQQQFTIVDSEEAKLNLLRLNDPRSLLARSVSERFELGSYAESLRTIEARAFFMAIQSREVLRRGMRSEKNMQQSQEIDVPNVRRKRDLAAWGQRNDVHEIIAKYNDDVKFRNVQGISSTMGKTYVAQVQSFARVMQKSSAAIRKEVPLIVNRDPAKKRVDATRLLQNSTGLLRQLYIEHKFLERSERRMVSGCRFCHASGCVFNGMHGVVMQCAFNNFQEIHGNRSVPTILPNNKLTEEKAANNVSRTQPSQGSREKNFKVVIGVNRVKKPDEEVVCGVSIKQIVAFENAFGIGIDVCSRNNGSYLYQQDPVRSKPVIVNQFNTLWVSQTGGSTSGIGFYVSADPANENQTAKNILNIELESIF